MSTMSHTAPEDVKIHRHAFESAPIIPAAELVKGDVIHHWSPTGGTWKVDALLRDGRLRLVSDLGAVRYLTPAAIDAKGARLHHRGTA